MKLRLSISREGTAPNVTRQGSITDATNKVDPVQDITARGIGDQSRLTDKTIGEDNTDYRAPGQQQAITLKQITTDEQQTGRDKAREASDLGAKGGRPDSEVFTYSNDAAWQPKSEFERLFAPLGERLAAILRGEGPGRIVNRPAGVEVTAIEDQERCGVPATTMMASESRGKSPSAKARSQMLKLIMPELSREQGDQLAQAIKNHDGETVQRILTQIGSKLNKVVSRKK